MARLQDGCCGEVYGSSKVAALFRELRRRGRLRHRAVRYRSRYGRCRCSGLTSHGVTSIDVSVCKAETALNNDILLLNRKTFLESKPSFAINFIDAVEAKRLRLFQGINYPALAARQAETEGLVRSIGDGVAAGTRQGYGAMELPTAKGDLCLMVSGELVVHEEMLRSVAAVTDGKKLAAKPPYADLDQLFAAILREQCRVFYGSAQTLSQISQALIREEVKYSFLPTWLDEDVLSNALLKRAAEEQEKVKKAEAARLAAEEQAKIAARQRERTPRTR
jgi:hypothetical protein